MVVVGSLLCVGCILCVGHWLLLLRSFGGGLVVFSVCALLLACCLFVGGCCLSFVVYRVLFLVCMLRVVCWALMFGLLCE